MTAALLLGGCEKVLEVDFDDVTPQVVVMSSVHPDTTVNVRLTYSRFILDDSPFRTVDDAVLSLEVNGVDVHAAQSCNSGDYVLDYRPQEGDRLKLRVKVPGRNEVTATTEVPRAAVVTNVRGTALASGDGENRYSVRFTLDDPSGEQNYYFVRLYKKSFYYSYYQYFNCNDYMLTDGVDVMTMLEGDFDVQSSSLLAFPDDNINGTSHEVELTMTAEVPLDSFYVEVTSMSRDRYLYELTAKLYDNGDTFDELFSEPVQIHCNVDGGIGIFAACTRKLFPITTAK